MRVYITGFSATGKTAAGRMLAGRLGVAFEDLNESIVEETHMPIQNLFREFGTEGVRWVETNALKNTFGGVIATGDGTMTSPANVTYMKSNGVIVLLVLPPSIIAGRLEHENPNPLLKGDRNRSVRRLLFSRAAYYCAADYALDVTGKSTEQIVDDIERILIRIQ